MAKKISELPAGTALGDADLVAVVQSGSTNKVTGAQIRQLATKSEAEAGTDNVKTMTPLRVKEAIAIFGGGGGGSSTKDVFFRRATLDLNFAENQYRAFESGALANKTLTDVVTTTRADAATYNGKFGIASAATNIARIEHAPFTGVPLGLLTEGDTTNLCTQSQTFNTTWSASGATISADTAVAPDGTTTADKIVEGTTPTFNVLVTNSSVGSGSTANRLTFSVYVKPAGRQYVQLRLWQSVDTRADFDLVNGVSAIVSGSGTTAMEYIGDGWWRVAVTITPTGSGASTVQIKLGAAYPVVDYTGDGTSGMFVWGAQVETQDAPTAYKATTTAVTVGTTTSVSTLATAITTGFTAYLELAGNTHRTIAAVLWTLTNGQSSTGAIKLTLLADKTLRLTGFSSDVDLIAAGGYVPGTKVKIGISFDRFKNEVLISINGAAPVTRTVGAVAATLNRIGLGFDGALATSSTEARRQITSRVTLMHRPSTAAELQVVTA